MNLDQRKFSPEIRYWVLREPKKCFYEFLLCIKKKIPKDVAKIIFDFFMRQTFFYKTKRSKFPRFLELIFPRTMYIFPNTLTVKDISVKLLYRDKVKVKIHFELKDTLLGARLNIYENDLLSTLDNHIPQKSILAPNEMRKNYHIIYIFMKDLYTMQQPSTLTREYQNVESVNLVRREFLIKKNDIVNDKLQLIITGISNIPDHIPARSRLNYTLQ